MPDQASDSNRDEQMDELIEEIRRLARATEYVDKKPKPDSTLWGQAARAATTFLLAVSLTLGVKHEVDLAPVQPIAVAQTSTGHQISQQAALKQFGSDVKRLSDWLQSPSHEPESLQELRGLLTQDLKQIIKLPCSTDTREEAVDLIVQLQIDAANKVAQHERITSTERRAQRLLTTLQALCG